ncbi:MAG: DUF3482 domain-containing protein [Pseudomonadota bacterium]
MNNLPADIQLVLVSHTNNGKTTLTRTLLGADVGEVRDAAHVTQRSEAHTLLTSQAGDKLQLWDTPGFGDSVRLLKRLGNADNPIGWFLREVLDRYRDRPFWLSQQALRTARDTCDVVLYLVNASESPEDAGYVPAEMQVLAWLGKPVLVLLNQIGPPRPMAQEHTEVDRWRGALQPYPLVRQIVPLDAFTRCWVHERVFYEALGSMVSTDKMAGQARLLAAWDARNIERFSQAMALTVAHLSAAAAARETIVSSQRRLLKSALQAAGIARPPGKSSSKPSSQPSEQHSEQAPDDAALAMQRLLERLERDIVGLTAKLATLHRLDAGAAASIIARVNNNFAIRAPIGKAQAGMLGALIAGATTGLTADLATGGLTAGLGAILGGVMGAITFAGAAWGFNATTDRQTPTVQFAPPLLRSLTATGVLRYLAVIHFGRGRGQFVEGEAPAFWQAHVERAVATHEQNLQAVWQLLRAEGTRSQGEARLSEAVTAITVAVLQDLYPESVIPGLLALSPEYRRIGGYSVPAY